MTIRPRSAFGSTKTCYPLGERYQDAILATSLANCALGNMTLKNFFTGLLVVVLLLAVYIIHAGFVVVHVRSPQANIWVPVPIGLGHIIGSFVNVPVACRPELENALEYREAAMEILSQMKDLPDADLIEVTKPNEHVQIFKRGDSLCIEVNSANEKVKARVPLRTVEHLLRALNHQDVNVGEVVACLASESSGDIVHVQTEQEEVLVSIW
jgi:hypothetical protein